MSRCAAIHRSRTVSPAGLAASAGLILLLFSSCSAAKSFAGRIWPGQSPAKDPVSVPADDTGKAAAAQIEATGLSLSADTALLVEGTRLVQGISIVPDNNQRALYARYMLPGQEPVQAGLYADVWFVPEPLLLADPLVPDSCKINGAMQVLRSASAVGDSLVYIIETANYTICAAVHSGFGRDCDFLIPLAERVQYFYTYVAADLSLFSFPSAIELR